MLPLLPLGLPLLPATARTVPEVHWVASGPALRPPFKSASRRPDQNPSTPTMYLMWQVMVAYLGLFTEPYEDPYKRRLRPFTAHVSPHRALITTL